ncbi:MAG: helix-turn-helix domain-containing protein, partial [Chloroflexota bacterium]|nr:helix-turn-helix domain-containing protein [Chloroflexota bacterium]
MDTAEQRSFGSLLKRYRAVAHLTQEELAERAGLSARALSYLEQGARTPYRDTTRRLADALALAPPDRAAFEAAARRTDDSLTPAAPGHAHGHTLRPLVGRAHELALVERVLSGEGSSVLLLAGEPGIGKSRVLQEAAARAEDSGWCVLRGGCQRRDGQEPYAPLLGAIQAHIRAQTPAQLRA